MEHIDYVTEVEKDGRRRIKKEIEIGRKKGFNSAWTMFPPCGACVVRPTQPCKDSESVCVCVCVCVCVWSQIKRSLK